MQGGVLPIILRDIFDRTGADALELYGKGLSCRYALVRQVWTAVENLNKSVERDDHAAVSLVILEVTPSARGIYLSASEDGR